MNPQFKTYELNEFGKADVKAIRDNFGGLLDSLNALGLPDAREFCICKTRLEEACFFAIKSCSMKSENQVKHQHDLAHPAKFLSTEK
jgi:hypothetical protein